MEKPESNVYLIDCMEYMAALPDKYFDLAVVDPPYGINIANHNIGFYKGKRFDKHYEYQKKDWDTNAPSENYFLELFRVSKNQIIWGANYFNLPPSQGYVFWNKLANGNFSDGELAYTSFPVPLKMFTYAWNGFNKGKLGNSIVTVQDKRIHPTQKPIALYKWILKNYAKPGDKIFDSHMGSQSSRIAAYDMGFDYWGCEIDKDYFEAGNKRFDNFIKQLKINFE